MSSSVHVLIEDVLRETSGTATATGDILKRWKRETNNSVYSPEVHKLHVSGVRDETVSFVELFHNTFPLGKKYVPDGIVSGFLFVCMSPLPSLLEV